MPSEARRGFTRIASNYFRLITNVGMGLVLVPMLLGALGNKGWALIALLTSTVGLVSMVEEITRGSLIREMGHAYHRKDRKAFRSVYNSAIAITTLLALVALVVFAALWAIVPFLKIDSPELVPAARWIVVTRAVETTVVLLLAAPFNMYKVTERMVAFNCWQVAARASYLVAASWVLWGMGTQSVAERVTAYAFSSMVLFVLVTLLSVTVIMVQVRGLIPSPRLVSREAIRTVLHIGGLNAAASVATNLHRRLAPLLMNLAFDLWGNLVLGLAIQITVSVRRLTTGMTGGLDAVSARMSTTGDQGAVRTLSHHSTRLHGVAAFGAGVAVCILAGPLMMLWLGKRIEDPAATIPPAATLVRIMLIGMIARAISDGWLNILYGAGHVSRYAWLVIAGGVLNPLLFVVLLFVLPEPYRYTAVCWAYSAVFVFIHSIAVPWRSAAILGSRFWDFYAPLVRPLIVAVVCSPILLVARVPLEDWTLLRLAVAGGLYGAAYAAGCLVFVMEGHERLRFGRAALRRLPGRRTKSPDADALSSMGLVDGDSTAGGKGDAGER